jgi:Phosphoinositide phospholipase C, Ca2+-dependent
MFVDSAESDPLAAVIIANDPTDRSRIDAAARAGFLVRTRADESGLPEQRAAALATGAHALSSDFPTVFAIPGGTPSRCNPVTAPAACTSAAIEDPAHLR